MAKYACPVCGDPNIYKGWVDLDPPEGCPHDPSWQRGEPRRVNSVTECSYQMDKARQRAYWRKICPEAFDADGNIKPGGWKQLGPKLQEEQMSGRHGPVIP